MTLDSSGAVPAGAPIVYGVFWGTSRDVLVLNDGPLATASTATAGIISASPVYWILGATPGERVYLKVAGWSSVYGRDWISAMRGPGYYGETDVRQVTLGFEPGPGTIIWQSATGTNPDRFLPLKLFTVPDVPWIYFGDSSYVVSEHTGQVQVVIRRQGDQPEPISVEWFTADITAVAGLDYLASTGMVTFAVGETQKVVRISILNDGKPEALETFSVQLRNPTGGSALSVPNKTTIQIQDADRGIFFEPSVYTVVENQGTVEVIIRREDDLANPESVSVLWLTEGGTAQPGSDYVADAGAVTFAGGEVQKTVSIRILDDAARENEETFTVRLIAVQGDSGLGRDVVATIRIDSDDLAARHVRPDSPSPGAPYTTWDTAAHIIQDAVDEAWAGETVLVTNGVYAVGAVVGADGQTNRVALTRRVVLQSVNGPEVTVISGAADDDQGSGSIRCVYVGSNAIVSGFTLTNGHTVANGGGAWCETSGMLTNCVLTGNDASGVGGAVYGGTVLDCTLTGNSSISRASAADSCILNNCVISGNSGNGASGSTLYNCVVSGNSGVGAYGGNLYNSIVTGNSGWGAQDASLQHCTISGNLGGGVYGGSSYNCIIFHNTVGPALNHVGAFIEYSCTTPVPTDGMGNIDADPQLATASHLSSTSPCIGAGNFTYSTGVDIDGEPWANPPCMGADQLSPANVTGALAVQIQANRARVAVGFPVVFTALNTGPIRSSVWDLGEGIRLTNQPFASHTWISPGTYTIFLHGFNDSFPQGVTAGFQVTVVEQPVHYVNQANLSSEYPYASWQTAATNIQDAVDAATVPGSLILAADGIYASGGGVNASRVALTNPLVLRSVNGPAVTVINGDGLRCAYVGPDATLSGFTLTNGNAWRGSQSGGGAWCEPSGVVSNCVLTGNSAIFGGGASGGTFERCILTKNAARLPHPPFDLNPPGGGAYRCVLRHCILVANSAGEGGGVAEATLYNCVLTGNSSWGSGAARSSMLFNCILTSNTASIGGGAYESILYNCTVANNSASEFAGGVFGGTNYNTIVYFNEAPLDPNYAAYEWDPIRFEFSCTTPLPIEGIGNIDAEPRFVNAVAGDFRLLPDSPCIDAGTNLSAFLTTDLDGLPRPLDGDRDGVARFDMGAYEFNPYHFASALQVGPDGFQFTVRGEPGKSVRIERSGDLVHWEFAAEVPIPASGQTLIDPAATTERQLFYRLISIP